MNYIDKLYLSIFKKNDVKKKPVFQSFELDASYLYLINNFKCGEVISDVNIFPEEKLKTENKYFHDHYLELSKKWWLIGDNAQGDFWFISRNNIIYFYDHNDGEFESNNFQNLDISFMEFMQFIAIVKKYDDEFDKFESQEEFLKEVNNLNNNFYDKFPYALF